MKLEEAIVYFESLLKRFEEMHETETSYWGKVHTETTIEAIRTALTAIRPVSREQVEKMRGEWNYSHTTEIDHFAVVKCSKCGHEAFAIALYVKDENFCPHCGAPMTDEAVQMVMERLEALKDGRV
jgi:hypothetical protein